MLHNISDKSKYPQVDDSNQTIEPELDDDDFDENGYYKKKEKKEEDK